MLLSHFTTTPTYCDPSRDEGASVVTQPPPPVGGFIERAPPTNVIRLALYEVARNLGAERLELYRSTAVHSPHQQEDRGAGTNILRCKRTHSV